MGGIGISSTAVQLLGDLRKQINFTTPYSWARRKLVVTTQSSSSSTTEVTYLPHPSHETVSAIFSILAVAGFLENLIFLVCLIRRPKRYQPSFNFIGHLFITNMITCAYLLPVFVVNLRLESLSPFTDRIPLLCRWQAFFTCVLWTTLVSYFVPPLTLVNVSN